jgi:glycosyltransferase involved in cell wall biosynthesis
MTERIRSQRGRIVHVIGALRAGGAERFVVDLLIELTGRGVPVELLGLFPGTDSVGSTWLRRLTEVGVPLTQGPASRRRSSTVWWLANQLAAPDIDVVHVHLFNVEVGYYAASFVHRPSAPVVRTVHNTNLPRPGIEEWTFNHSKIRCSITCGKAVHDVYQGITSGSMACIPNGLNFNWPRHDPLERARRQAALGLDPGRTHYMAVGRMDGPTLHEAQKAHDDLINGWRKGELGLAGGVLHLFGDGNLRPLLEEMAGTDASIVFHGVSPSVPTWMASSDVFVLPSRFEGLPLAGIEATATGLPAVFSDIAPLRELGNSTATYFPVGDIQGIVRRLTERLHTRDTASELAVEHARRRFGIERCADEYLRVYESVRSSV